MHMYSRDKNTGQLTALNPATIANGSNATGLFGTPDGKYIYSVDSGGIETFSRDTTTGQLTAINRSKNIYDIISNFEVNGATISPDGKNIYITDWNGRVLPFSIDGSTGIPAAMSAVGLGATDMGSYGIAVSPDGRFAYVGSEDDCNSGVGCYTLTTLSRDVSTGSLSVIGTKIGVPEGGTTPSIVVSADGKNLYYTTGVINMFTRNIDTGLLTPLNPVSAKGDNSYSSGLAISSDGRNVYSIGGSGNVFMLSRNLVNGQLVVMDPASIKSDPDYTLYGNILVSPDNKNLYFAGSISHWDGENSINTGYIYMYTRK